MRWKITSRKEKRDVTPIQSDNGFRGFDGWLVGWRFAPLQFLWCLRRWINEWEKKNSEKERKERKDAARAQTVTRHPLSMMNEKPGTIHQPPFPIFLPLKWDPFLHFLFFVFFSISRFCCRLEYFYLFLSEGEEFIDSKKKREIFSFSNWGGIVFYYVGLVRAALASLVSLGALLTTYKSEPIYLRVPLVERLQEDDQERGVPHLFFYFILPLVQAPLPPTVNFLSVLDDGGGAKQQLKTEGQRTNLFSPLGLSLLLTRVLSFFLPAIR